MQTPLSRRDLLGLLAGLSLTVATACAGDDDRLQAERYCAAMVAPLRKNAALAQVFLEFAAAVKRAPLPEDDLGRRFEQAILPPAKELAADAEAILAEGALVEPHAALAGAWADRAAAYEAMFKAWSSGDVEAFERAAAQHNDAKNAEHDAITALNALLLPFGLKLDHLPNQTG
ncbi:MAG: hypothetical protein RIT28_1973 [Pseudomonadota bacterium]|jgi:hypothetical protein